MHICKFVLSQVFDKEDGGRDSLFLCNSGDNAVMVSGVILDITGNPADADRDRFPDSVPISTPDPMPTDPAPVPDPVPDPVPAPEPDPAPADPAPADSADPTA